MDDFWEHVDRGCDPDGCWVWRGLRGDYGYGRVRYQHHTWVAHRLSWTIANGAIPKGLFVCHTCDNPPCVNPAHLFLGTPADNTRDMIAKGRSVSPRRLTDADIDAIRRASAEGRTFADVGLEFGISATWASQIARRKAWVDI